MKAIFRQNQLFTFLLYCNGEDLERTILDCGAGGNCPPLAIFADHGYKTYGIDIDENQIAMAKKFEEQHGLNLNIEKGDMRALSFFDESISFMFSYNSIFHMSKKEIQDSINEMKRVLKKGGLIFINFASVHDMRSTQGTKVGDGEYLQMEYGKEVLHSFFGDNEAENYFEGFEVIYKENRVRDGFSQKDMKITMGFIDYILRKK